jgi:hypothetical protein
MTSESVAATLREVFAAEVVPAISAVVPDHPRERAGLVGAFIIGLATTRDALVGLHHRHFTSEWPPSRLISFSVEVQPEVRCSLRLDLHR